MRSLAKGKTKFVMLTTKPANVFAPTVTELEAGIDLSCAIADNTFRWGAKESEKVAEDRLCDTNKSEALGAGNYEGRIDVFREFDPMTGKVDPAQDKAFAAVKTKGTTGYFYARRTGKKSTDPWAAGDEIYLGGEALTDTPMAADNTDGYVKYGVILLPQNVRDFINVAGA